MKGKLKFCQCKSYRLFSRDVLVFFYFEHSKLNYLKL